ncbi:hypothetical protein BDR26DRAFT_889984 [Obelidium mucronatum]|nr:hypothetical protein BDR26DRAFT_889984 [Obelidium mucronatum]
MDNTQLLPTLLVESVHESDASGSGFTSDEDSDNSGVDCEVEPLHEVDAESRTVPRLQRHNTRKSVESKSSEYNTESDSQLYTTDGEDTDYGPKSVYHNELDDDDEPDSDSEESGDDAPSSEYTSTSRSDRGLTVHSEVDSTRSSVQPRQFFQAQSSVPTPIRHRSFSDIPPASSSMALSLSDHRLANKSSTAGFLPLPPATAGMPNEDTRKSRHSMFSGNNEAPAGFQRDNLPLSPPTITTNLAGPSRSSGDYFTMNMNPKSLLTKQKSRISALPSTSFSLPTSPALSSSTPTTTPITPSAANQYQNDQQQLPETLSDTDPFLLKLIALTSSPISPNSLATPSNFHIQDQPPPRKSSFHYTSVSTPPSSKDHSRSSSPEPQPSITSSVTSKPPISISAPADHSKHQITASTATVQRAARARNHIAQKYQLLAYQMTTLQQPYNPLAVIRYRREAWQAAVKAKAPSGDIRKVRMLKGGWDVGAEEMKDYLEVMASRRNNNVGGGAATATQQQQQMSPQQQQQQQQGQDFVLSEKRSGASLLGGKASVFGKWKESLTRGSTGSSNKLQQQLQHQNQQQQQNIHPSSSSALLGGGDNTNTIFSNPSLPTDAEHRYQSLGRRQSASESLGASQQIVSKQSTQKVLRKLRSGTVALNVMLGKGVAYRTGHNMGRRKSTLLTEQEQAESPAVVIQESALLNMFLGGGLGGGGYSDDNSGGEGVNENNLGTVGAGGGSDGEGERLDDFVEARPQDQEQLQDMHQRLLEPARIEDDPSAAQPRMSRTRNPFKSPRINLRSPERPTIMSTVAGDIERWIGNVGGYGAYVGEVGGDGEGASNLATGETAAAGDEAHEKPRRQRKMRLGRRRKEEVMEERDVNVGSITVDEAADAHQNTPSPPLTEGRKRQAKHSLHAVAASVESGSMEHDGGDPTTPNTLFRLPRLKVKADGGSLDQPMDSNGPVRTRKKIFGGGNLLAKEDKNQPPHHGSSSPTERRKGKRVVRLGKEKRVVESTLELSDELGASPSPVLIRRKSSKKFRRKSSLGIHGLNLKDPSHAFDSPSELTSSAVPGKDTETSSDVVTTKSDVATASSARAKVIVNDDLESQVVDIANAVLRLLKLGLDRYREDRDSLVARVRPYAELIATFNIISNPKPLLPINLKELSSSTDQLTATLVSPKFITHEAQYQSLLSNLEKMSQAINSLSKALENGDALTKSMIQEMELLGSDINERGSRRIKVLEDHIQHKEAVKRGPMHAVMEIVYQFVEIVLIAVGYIIWLVYKGVKFVEQGYGMVFAAPPLKDVSEGEEVSFLGEK